MFYIFFSFVLIMFILIICVIIFIVTKMLKITTGWKQVTNKIHMFSTSPSDEAVYAIMDDINRLGNIPNQPTCWDSMRAAYRLVAESENISDKCKKDFKTFLLSKGVNVR